MHNSDRRRNAAKTNFANEYVLLELDCMTDLIKTLLHFDCFQELLRSLSLSKYGTKSFTSNQRIFDWGFKRSDFCSSTLK